MKRLLIIEDDENKRQQLAQCIKQTWPTWKIGEAKSFQSGLREVIKCEADLILLDMTMPTYDIGQDEDGGRPQHFAGRSILRQMERRKIDTPVIVVTQFDVFGVGNDILTRDQLDGQLRAEHSRNYKGTVYYNAAMDEWKSHLCQMIQALTETEE